MIHAIKGIIKWTISCIDIWVHGLKDVAKNKNVAWKTTQTFFEGENAVEIRNKYALEEKRMFELFTLENK